MISYGKQDITDEDIKAVVDVLQSDYLTQGPMVPLFEDRVKEYCGVSNAVAVNSATSGLHIACLALDVGPGDIVWTSSVTFVASSNCALYCGAKVDFIDIDPQTYNISVNALRLKLIEAKNANKLPKIVIPVHLTGQSSQMSEIHALSKEYGFKIIEDASHAIGGKYLGESVGNCSFSDITVFSFHPVKIITTCEGGLVTTNNNELARRLRLLRSHGITRENNQLKNVSHGSWYYEQSLLGFNYRMTDIQAALGISQMKRIDKFIHIRHNIADKYKKGFSNLPLKLPYQLNESFSSFHLYIIRFNFDKLSFTQKEAFDMMLNDKIGVNLHYIPVYYHPFYQQLGFQEGYCEEAENFYKEAMSIPIHPNLSDKDQSKVINSISKIFEK
jgi:UDP-4-amino-4,6-dideoxy-N-acetyl-beta-L-altrosamine transaminase